MSYHHQAAMHGDCLHGDCLCGGSPVRRRLPPAAAAIVVGCLLVAGLVGCDSHVDMFEPNRLYAEVSARRQHAETGQLAQQVADGVAALMTEALGTPDQPRLPTAVPADLLDIEKLQRAAGPTYSDKQDVHYGTYRALCVVCHGINGSGTGPAAALQNPYPRDFRAGVFKFKSTAREAKPTKQDLRRLLIRGEPGTGMPTFSRLPDTDIDALVDYVIYLAIRGEAERRLIQLAVADWSDQFAAADSPLTNSDRLAGVSAEFRQLADETIAAIANQWQNAQPLAIPPLPNWDDQQQAAAIERGQELFHGQLANCWTCHGRGGDGGRVTLDYDDWTKEFTTNLAITPSDRAAVKPLRRLGGLPPRAAEPRRLTWGANRGPDEWSDLYRRLAAGIAGTPMPGLLINDQPGGNGLEPEQVWDLVAYLKSIQHGSRQQRGGDE